jgi:tetratricopeptide (TPR) repeat protein
MRQLVERLQAQLVDFVVQRDDFGLVTRCSDSDAAIVGKLFEGLDESRGSELYWLVVDEFAGTEEYAEACVRTFAVRHDAARLMQRQQGLPELPPLPEVIASRGRLAPAARVRELIVFSRSLLPTLEGCAVVWGFLPMNVRRPSEWSSFVGALSQHEFPFPWCHHVRMIVRDGLPKTLLDARTQSAPRLRTCTVDFSPEKIQEALEEEAADESAPLAARVNDALMLAGIDFSHARHERAIQQYEIVHRYAAAVDNPTLAAISLNGMGEVHRARGDAERAGDCFHAALAPAGQASEPPVPVLFSLYTNLGELRHSQGRWEEAEVFLRGAAEFALLLRDPAQRLRCWDLLGEAQAKQGKPEATETWKAGAIVARKLGDEERFGAFAQRIREHLVAQRNQGGIARLMREIESAAAAGDSTEGPAGGNPPGASR